MLDRTSGNPKKLMLEDWELELSRGDFYKKDLLKLRDKLKQAIENNEKYEIIFGNLGAGCCSDLGCGANQYDIKIVFTFYRLENDEELKTRLEKYNQEQLDFKIETILRRGMM